MTTRQEISRSPFLMGAKEAIKSALCQTLINFNSSQYELDVDEKPSVNLIEEFKEVVLDAYALYNKVKVSNLYLTDLTDDTIEVDWDTDIEFPSNWETFFLTALYAWAYVDEFPFLHFSEHFEKELTARIKCSFIDLLKDKLDFYRKLSKL